MNESRIAIGLCQQKRRNIITHLNSVEITIKPKIYAATSITYDTKSIETKTVGLKSFKILTYCGKSKPLASNRPPAKF